MFSNATGSRAGGAGRSSFALDLAHEVCERRGVDNSRPRRFELAVNFAHQAFERGGVDDRRPRAFELAIDFAHQAFERRHIDDRRPRAFELDVDLAHQAFERLHVDGRRVSASSLALISRIRPSSGRAYQQRRDVRPSAEELVPTSLGVDDRIDAPVDARAEILNHAFERRSDRYGRRRYRPRRAWR